MNRVCGHPNDTHVRHQPMLRTKGWETGCTATLLLGSEQAAGQEVDMVVRRLVLVPVRVEGGDSRHTVHWEELRVWQVLPSMLVESCPVHIRSP